ncbi:MAG: cysteine--tRNA ligase [Patescibacteria group bacterium]|jgi:cysteinyl-tRNA synthetase
MGKLFLYNTLTRKKEEFKPLKNGLATFYYCGPTVYWIQHIGNLRGAYCSDIVRRTLEYVGYKVKMVRNYTDVGHLTSDEDQGEDKMATVGLGVECKKCHKIFNSGIATTKKAFITGTFLNNIHVCPYCKYENLIKDKKGYIVEDSFRSSPEEIAQKYIVAYEKDAADLNILDPWKKPRATRHIKEMQKMVAVLLKKGFAYATPLAVYFDVSKFPNYTALSGQNLEKNMAGEGSGEVSDSAKKNPQDFALWFFRAGAHEKAIQFWRSPFKSPEVKHGEGFPGWHIECSAMSKKYLGATIDIHMGGMEHIPVHHTNEIAQSESANGVKYVDYWLHNEHLLVNNEKMAKSKGTSFSLAEVKTKVFTPLALRYYFLSANYRSKQNFTWEALSAAEDGLLNLYNQLYTIKNSPLEKVVPVLGQGVSDTDYKQKFISALAEDFNTPATLAVLSEVLADKNLSSQNKLKIIFDFDKVLGLDLENNSKIERVKIQTDATLTGKTTTKIFEKFDFKKIEDEEIIKMFNEREQARIKKLWGESDRLRDELLKLGYYIKDEKSGVSIFRVVK